MVSVSSYFKQRRLFPVFFILFLAGITVLWQKIPQRIIANQYFVKGLSEFQRGQIPEAEKLFSRSLVWNQKHLRSAEYLVLIAATRGNHQETLQRFYHARSTGSSWAPIYSIAASLQLGSGRLDDARQVLEEGIVRGAAVGQDVSALQNLLKNIEKLENVTRNSTIQ